MSKLSVHVDDGKDGGESSTFVPAGFHALHSNGCMRGFQYQALSVYDSASSTATHKETHYKVHGASQNFDLCINGLRSKLLIQYALLKAHTPARSLIPY